MKRLLTVLLLLATVLSVAVSARGADAYQFLLLEDSTRRLMVITPDKGLQLLTDQYVLEYHYDEQARLVYYTAMENGWPVLCAIDPEGGEPVYHPIIEDEETLAAREEPPISLLAAPNKTVGQMVQAAMEIIYANEGKYGSVNANDNGALSIGKVQWHATRALNLLQTIVKADEVQARAILGDALCDEIITADSWGSRTVDAVEKNAISALLVTEAGKAAQDALAETDITSYMNYGINKGLESSLALVYFADLQNQWGSGGAYKQLQKAAGTGAICDVTLEMLHQACLDYTQNYHTRRTKVYDYCLSLGWEEFTVTVAAPKNVKAFCEGDTVSVVWDGVDNAACYSCRIIANVWGQGYVTVAEKSEIEDTSCTLTVEDAGYYFAEVTAWAGDVSSESSVWASFDVLAAPEIRSVSVSGEEAVVQWSSVNAPAYVYEILYEDGTPACEPVETRDTSCTATLEAGRAYRVFVTAKSSTCVTDSGEGYAFATVGIPHAKVQPPDRGNVTVTWENAANAQGYQVCLMQNGEAVFTAETEKLSHTFGRVPDGQYTALVTAYSDMGESHSEEIAVIVTGTDPQGTLQAETEAVHSDTTHTVEVSLFYLDEPCLLLAAGYQGGQLKTVTLETGLAGCNRLLLEGIVDEVRVMVLDNPSAMMPLLDALQVLQPQKP